MLGGLEINVLVIDDWLDLDYVVDKVSELININGIDVLVGVNFFRVMFVVYDLVVCSWIFFIGISFGLVLVVGCGCNWYFFLIVL